VEHCYGVLHLLFLHDLAFLKRIGTATAFSLSVFCLVLLHSYTFLSRALGAFFVQIQVSLCSSTDATSHIS
jgi:hypothetical protein